MKITLKVNGVTRTLEAEPDMPLLWALRDFLSLKGAKYGCGIGACGACTVLVNGRAMRSCAVPLKALEGDEVRTIEGLGGNHPVQLAWLEEQVPQCGYCQSGQIMQAHGRRDPGRHERRAVPLRHLSAHRGGGTPRGRCAGDREGGLTMLTRRDFVFGSGALAIAVSVPLPDRDATSCSARERWPSRCRCRCRTRRRPGRRARRSS